MGTLFGISGKSNRDGTGKSHWGKNEFNSSFPAALLCYMNSIGIDPVYLTLSKQLSIEHSFISVNKLFMMDPGNDSIYFAFEDTFQPHQGYVRGSLQRSDLVIMDTSLPSSPCKRGFEIKLTALPDNSTHQLQDSDYSCELVFRPSAVEQLILSIAHVFEGKRSELLDVLAPVCSKVYNWRRRQDVSDFVPEFITCLDTIFTENLDDQYPFAIQPIWKTIGKKAVLADNCLDVFVWSNLAFTRLFIDRAREGANSRRFDRHKRSVVWVARMLYDFAQNGFIEPALTTSEMAYELQTDKAFAVGGRQSWMYLNCNELTCPRIRKDQIKEVILQGGHNLLSPERRFDAIIVNTADLFG